jgi:hypothetical protein
MSQEQVTVGIDTAAPEYPEFTSGACSGVEVFEIYWL